MFATCFALAPSHRWRMRPGGVVVSKLAARWRWHRLPPPPPPPSSSSSTSSCSVLLDNYPGCKLGAGQLFNEAHFLCRLIKCHGCVCLHLSVLISLSVCLSVATPPSSSPSSSPSSDSFLPASARSRDTVPTPIMIITNYNCAISCAARAPPVAETANLSCSLINVNRQS